MNNYFKGFVSGFFLCLCIIVFNGSSVNQSEQKVELLQRLDDIEQKIDFNYKIIQKLKNRGIIVCPTAINGINTLNTNLFKLKRKIVT